MNKIYLIKNKIKINKLLDYMRHPCKLYLTFQIASCINSPTSQIRKWSGYCSFGTLSKMYRSTSCLRYNASQYLAIQICLSVMREDSTRFKHYIVTLINFLKYLNTFLNPRVFDISVEPVELLHSWWIWEFYSLLTFTLC